MGVGVMVDIPQEFPRVLYPVNSICSVKWAVA